jgi:cell division protein FtsI (penicillin-binding protein 3)
MRSRNRFSRRLYFVSAVLVLGAAAITAEMVQLTVVRGEELAGKVRKVSCVDSVRMSYRGQILDRNGSALAASMAASRVAARRAVYTYDAKHAVQLAPLLGKRPDELDKMLRDDPRRFLWLSKSLGVDDSNAIRRLDIGGIDIYRDQYRTYPQGPLAAHIVGFTGEEAKGLEGIELALDEEIRGTPVSVRVCRDVHGQVFLNEGDRSGIVRGATVELTIDATLQAIAEAELNAQVAQYEAAGGTVVVMDPQTGEILAMANAPAFDPNRYFEATKPARRNRSVTDVFEPGSTAKALVIAAALDAGVVKPEDEFFCENGAMRVGRWTIHDHHPHGTLNVTDILKVSSNICTAKIGALLGQEKLGAYLMGFGFGRTSGALGLIGESKGLMADPARWGEVRTANISFGQGVSITALQLASSFATLANDGARMKPYVIKSVRRSDGTLVVDNEPQVESQVISADVARKVSAMLESVTNPGGTATRAAIEGVRVAGKTGTAQKAEAGRYSKDRWLSSFVGYLPADQPRMVIAASIDEPKGNHFGGVVAAPVFKRIAEASLDYLGIHRDVAPVPAPPVIAIEAEVPPRELPNVIAYDGTMPDLRGLSLRTAMRALDGCACDLRIEGHGYVVEQQPEPGVVLDRTASVALTLDAVAAN